MKRKCSRIFTLPLRVEWLLRLRVCHVWLHEYILMNNRFVQVTRQMIRHCVDVDAYSSSLFTHLLLDYIKLYRKQLLVQLSSVCWPGWWDMGGALRIPKCVHHLVFQIRHHSPWERQTIAFLVTFFFNFVNLFALFSYTLDIFRIYFFYSYIVQVHSRYNYLYIVRVILHSFSLYILSCAAAMPSLFIF